MPRTSLAIEDPVFLSGTQVIGEVIIGDLAFLGMFDLVRRRIELARYMNFHNTWSYSVSKSGVIAFATDALCDPGSQGVGIYLFNQADLAVRRLFPLCEEDIRQGDEMLDAVAVSNDGTMVLFDRLNGLNDGIYLVSEGMERPRLLDRNGCYGAFSPDGKRVAFSTDERDGRTNEVIVVASVAGGEIRKLCAGFHPIWSPDGTRIGFTDRSNRRAGIIHADGSCRLYPAGEDSDSAFGAWDRSDDGCWIDSPAGIVHIDLRSGEAEVVVAADEDPISFECVCANDRYVGYLGTCRPRSQSSFERSFVHDRKTGERVPLFGWQADDEEVRRVGERFDELRRAGAFPMLEPEYLNEDPEDERDEDH